MVSDKSEDRRRLSFDFCLAALPVSETGLTSNFPESLVSERGRTGSDSIFSGVWGVWEVRKDGNPCQSMLLRRSGTEDLLDSMMSLPSKREENPNRAMARIFSSRLKI